MGLLRTRLGALVALATLVLTPGVRLACLAMCAAPPTVWQTAGGSPATERPPSADAAAAHAHHRQSPDAAPPAAAPPDAAMETAAAWADADTQCDAAPGSVCADGAGVLPRPSPRVAAGDVAIAPLGFRFASDAIGLRLQPARPPMRVAPPGPPPAPTPLRI